MSCLYWCWMSWKLTSHRNQKSTGAGARLKNLLSSYLQPHRVVVAEWVSHPATRITQNTKAKYVVVKLRTGPSRGPLHSVARHHAPFTHQTRGATIRHIRLFRPTDRLIVEALQGCRCRRHTRIRGFVGARGDQPFAHRSLALLPSSPQRPLERMACWHQINTA